MAVVSVQDLLDAGVHFGHNISRTNPKMKPYIYGKRNKISIIDLRETIKGLIRAFHVVSEVCANPDGKVLFVGTKKQAREAILESSQKCGMPFVIDRWLGGTLTNLETIRTRIKKLRELEGINLEDPTIPKKEIARIRRELTKIRRNLQGIVDLSRLPDLMIIVDPRKEMNSVREARKCGVPIVALCDTDCDPDTVDLVVPCNDDAIRSIRLIIGYLAEAVREGQKRSLDRQIYTKPVAEQTTTDADADTMAADAVAKAKERRARRPAIKPAASASPDEAPAAEEADPNPPKES
ncbi:MAG: 30S ribosomal protein S2 [Candidatus Brocadiia bacterium]